MINAFKTALDLILGYWWIITPVALFFIFKELRLEYVRAKYINSREWSLLEIKIPKQVEKTPKAMEQIFAGLHGVQTTPNFVEKWFEGKRVPWFSLEILGIGGELRFLIRAEKKFRNLVEAQVYAQYPDAEINEVEDYVANLPSKIPSDKYDAWGTELVLTKPDAYPIRTYPYFFEEAKKEEERIDPLASLSEVLNYLTPKEHLWVQILISPAEEDWKEEGEKLVEKLIGKKVKATKKGMMLEEAHGWFEALKETLHELFFGPLGPSSSGREEKKEQSLESLMQYLSPGKKEVVSAIEKNISKLGFATLIRFVYWAESDIFSKANVSAIIGAFKQFNTQNLNGFKPNGKISPNIDYFFKNRRNFIRKTRVLDNYKKRYFPHREFKGRGFVFNTEELATIYHIPGVMVEAPVMPRVEAKKGGPPSGLPVE